jgi:transposase
MVRRQLDERQWSKISAILEAERGAGRPGSDDRNFIEAVLWWRRTGVPWRDLPSEFGPWKTVFNRFDRSSLSDARCCGYESEVCSQACASLMSIETIRTIISLPLCWEASSSSFSRKHTSSNAADSVAEPRAVR